ncbi:hypothetical protein PSQ90_00880 [Devosia rhodophyticola]|uniref:Uncharacterized protein n=1 Tax=Devosia rhodophyticola TaxID=3026423 RepID=A0ABY7YXD7_9HYPH|nr:hypothetical protein [Devosia rhodophyticola]WDR06050.1 hypothetical protein PSQ90_00880 [Devosia rhodophyticola]
MSGRELRFKIEAYSPETFPMERLGQYLADLGAMLGEATQVHFVKLESGSTGLVHRVESEALPRVEAHIADVRSGEAEVVNLNAYRSINARLKEDNATAALQIVDSGISILDFPGKNIPDPQPPEIVTQPGTIDGIVIRLGGKDASVPLSVQNGDTIYRCNTTREMARQLGPHIFGSDLRFNGLGTWQRQETGAWTLNKFNVFSFVVLDTTPLPEFIAQLRSMNLEWEEVDDAWRDLASMRDDEDGAF